MSANGGADARAQRYLHDICKAADLSPAQTAGLLKNGLANLFAWVLERDPDTGAPSKALLGRPSPFNLIPVKHPVGTSAPGGPAPGISGPASLGAVQGAPSTSSRPGGPIPITSHGNPFATGTAGGSGSATTTERNSPAPERLGLLALVTHVRRAQERGRGAYPKLSLREQREVANLSGVLTQILDAGAERGEIDGTAPLSDLFRVHNDRATLGLIDSDNDPWQVTVQQKGGAFLRRPQTDIEGWALGQRGGPTGGDPVFTPVVPGGQSKLAQTQITDPSKRTTTPDPNGGGSG